MGVSWGQAHNEFREVLSGGPTPRMKLMRCFKLIILTIMSLFRYLAGFDLLLWSHPCALGHPDSQREVSRRPVGSATLLCPRTSLADTASASRIYRGLPTPFSHLEIRASIWETHGAPRVVSLDLHVESDMEPDQLHLLNISWISASFPFLTPGSKFSHRTLSLWC